MGRRYVVKEVSTSPAWTGTVWAVGCKHLASAEKLFEQKVPDLDDPRTGGILLIDREERKVLRFEGAAEDPEKVADYFGW